MVLGFSLPYSSGSPLATLPFHTVKLVHSSFEPCLSDIDAYYEAAEPDEANRFAFKPSRVDSVYEAWPLLTELSKEPLIHGPVERRAGALIDIDKSKLERRMSAYFDSRLSLSEIASICFGLTREASGFDPKKARETALKLEVYDSHKI